MNIQNNKGITIIKLVFVTSICIVFGGIIFRSLNGFLNRSKDARIIVKLSNVSKGLELYKINDPLPDPDSKIDIKIGETIIGKQGYLGENILSKLEEGNIKVSDILTQKGGEDKITYLLNNDGESFQLMTYVNKEKDARSVGFNIINSANATVVNKELFPVVFGKGLGILTNKDKLPIQVDQDIKTKGFIDVKNTNSEYYAYINNTNITHGTGYILQNLLLTSNNKGKGCLVNGDLIECLDITEKTTINYPGKTLKTCNEILKNNPEYINRNGIYNIKPVGQLEIQVFCDMTTDGGGWTRYFQGSDPSKYNKNHGNITSNEFSIELPKNIPLDNFELMLGNGIYNKKLTLYTFKDLFENESKDQTKNTKLYWNGAKLKTGNAISLGIYQKDNQITKNDLVSVYNYNRINRPGDYISWGFGTKYNKKNKENEKDVQGYGWGEFKLENPSIFYIQFR